MRTVNLYSYHSLTASNAVAYWNKIPRDGTIKNDVVDSLGASIPLSWQWVSGTESNQWIGSVGYLGGTGVGDAAWVDQDDILRQGLGVNATGRDAVLSSLDTNKTYTIKIFGSLVSGGRVLQASLFGATAQTLAITANNSEIILFTDVSPNVSGEIELFINSGTASDAYLTAVQITENDAPTTLTADSITAAPIYDGTTVTINLSNATNAAGKTLSIPQGALTATAQDINSISFLAPDIKTFGDKTSDYSTNNTITVTTGAE